MYVLVLVKKSEFKEPPRSCLVAKGSTSCLTGYFKLCSSTVLSANIWITRAGYKT